MSSGQKTKEKERNPAFVPSTREVSRALEGECQRQNLDVDERDMSKSWPGQGEGLMDLAADIIPRGGGGRGEGRKKLGFGSVIRPYNHWTLLLEGTNRRAHSGLVLKFPEGERGH